MHGDFDLPANSENELIHLLEHTPSLLALALETTLVTDLLFRRLGPPSLQDSATFSGTIDQSPAFLPLLHTLAIHVFINFQWHSVANMFTTSVGSFDSARRALKNFGLKIYGDFRDSPPLHGSDPNEIEEDAAERLLVVRKSGVNVTILDERDCDMLDAPDSTSPSSSAEGNDL
ncbi:unnamed protein product [Cyclocybe aegerita]|uniref:Uncharacterized protein n=1 Tax=Cyclocybe aegerita TaxID=1973307 RepID=A0A8S0WT66_CYCAE|nr:unnamed protein product [Cyclocybe aegerita]